MTKELRRARRDIMAEKPHHPRHVKQRKSKRCTCPESCLKHGIFIPLRESDPLNLLRKKENT